ncbi:MAG: phenylalanine 4-monooxygenase [Legionellales bacterium]|nr:phenylalanine 4-monooxygenase [Legionellales bacterium]
MGSKTSKYTAKMADSHGYIPYTDSEHEVWHDLIVRQNKIITERACKEYLHGLDVLNMSHDEIPQPHVISTALTKATGWAVEPVPALISYDRFFKLLSERRFPAASFIRSREELDYLQEPDIFHEYYGHCPMLTEPIYANFMQKYGEIGQKASAQDQYRLARLYWFTVEFGLVHTKDGIRCYGGGILSSYSETLYALESDIPQRLPFNFLDALRTPFRIDILQPLYYVIDSYQQLYDALDVDLFALINQARELGEFPPLFAPEKTDHE